MNRYRGEIEQRMASELAPCISVLVGAVITWSDISIYPARGYWTHDHQDVMAWTGYVQNNGHTFSLGSWNNMSDCLKHGFDIEDLRGEGYRAEANFVVYAKKETRPRADKYKSLTSPKEVQP